MHPRNLCTTSRATGLRFASWRTAGLSAALCLTALSFPRDAEAARLKELVDVQGFRSNHLVGFGIVAGLGGTGDDPNSFLARRPLATMLRNLGSDVDPIEIKARNVAMVMVTASLPPFARAGVDIDVTVSAIGTAKNLQGGTLITTALKGVDRQIYAVAQGQLMVGGYEVASTLSGSLNRKNHVTVARIPGGAIVEREVAQSLPKKELVLALKEPDFTTASRVAQAIDAKIGAKSASVRDPGAITVTIAETWKERVVELVATLEAIDAIPDGPARVVIDERTGTIVVGSNVTLGPAAIAYGGITIRVSESFGVSQPEAFSARGRTAVINNSEIDVKEQDGEMHALPAAPTVGAVTEALNGLGVKPRDLVPIFQALKAAGALRAEIQVL